MAEISVVRRYARALFDTALAQNALDQVEADLKGVDAVIRSTPTLMRALGAPTISTPRKKELLQQAFGARVGALTLRFMLLSVDRGRYTILPQVHGEFQRLANEQRNIQPVEVTAATLLTDDERQRLCDTLARKTGKTIDLKVTLDPSLMGGLIVRMGDTVIDGSVKSRLEQLHARLLTGKV